MAKTYQLLGKDRKLYLSDAPGLLGGNGQMKIYGHPPKNARQHAEFLSQIEENSAAHEDTVSWFKGLPIWLDVPGLRVVHARWHQPSREALKSFLDDRGCLTEAGILERYCRGTAAHAAVEILLKGPEKRLPDGIHFSDKDGHGSATRSREQAAAMGGSGRFDCLGRPHQA
jgi:hypothetical protein